LAEIGIVFVDGLSQDRQVLPEDGFPRVFQRPEVTGHGDGQQRPDDEHYDQQLN
jgi:hypothetical protein